MDQEDNDSESSTVGSDSRGNDLQLEDIESVEEIYKTYVPACALQDSSSTTTLKNYTEPDSSDLSATVVIEDVDDDEDTLFYPDKTSNTEIGPQNDHSSRINSGENESTAGQKSADARNNSSQVYCSIRDQVRTMQPAKHVAAPSYGQNEAVTAEQYYAMQLAHSMGMTANMMHGLMSGMPNCMLPGLAAGLTPEMMGMQGGMMNGMMPGMASDVQSGVPSGSAQGMPLTGGMDSNSLAKAGMEMGMSQDYTSLGSYQNPMSMEEYMKFAQNPMSTYPMMDYNSMQYQMQQQQQQSWLQQQQQEGSPKCPAKSVSEQNNAEEDPSIESVKEQFANRESGFSSEKGEAGGQDMSFSREPSQMGYSGLTMPSGEELCSYCTGQSDMESGASDGGGPCGMAGGCNIGGICSVGGPFSGACGKNGGYPNGCESSLSGSCEGCGASGGCGVACAPPTSCCGYDNCGGCGSNMPDMCCPPPRCPMPSYPMPCPPSPTGCPGMSSCCPAPAQNCLDIEGFVNKIRSQIPTCFPNCLTAPSPPCLGLGVPPCMASCMGQGMAQSVGRGMPQCCDAQPVNDTFHGQSVYAADYRPLCGNVFNHFPRCDTCGVNPCCGGCSTCGSCMSGTCAPAPCSMSPPCMPSCYAYPAPCSMPSPAPYQVPCAPGCGAPCAPSYPAPCAPGCGAPCAAPCAPSCGLPSSCGLPCGMPYAMGGCADDVASKMVSCNLSQYSSFS